MTVLDPDACVRVLAARDARFDGLFFVGITSTRIYCRPVCPARVAHADHRRFFDSAVAAEQAGFRPCLRCRPELAPGRARVDAISRLARTAAGRIEAGALNGQSVDDLAAELGVSPRHLRRVLEREFGVSPGELAQTHRLLLAKRLLADTRLPVTRIAFASGFQSLRRFNAAFREHYRIAPSALRRATPSAAASEKDVLRLTLAYRAPFDWSGLLALLRRDAMPGVEMVEEGRYGRTVRLGGHTGVVFVGPAARPADTHLVVELSPSLVPVLMPLIPQLRHIFDLDAEPRVIDAHLERTGLAPLVRQRPGVRLPGALDGFEVVLRSLAGAAARSASAVDHRVGRLVRALGEPIETGTPALSRFAPTAERVAETGASGLVALGIDRRGAEALAAVARRVADGMLRLEAGRDAIDTHRALVELGVSDRVATTIVLRALYWPDAFPSSDRALLRAAGVPGARELLELAERWRPWRAYAALHLWLSTT